MLGLTFEKLFLIAVIAALVIGPSRLPAYARRLAEIVRTLRSFVETTRSSAEADLGVPLRRPEWESLKQYDPREIVRNALRDDPREPDAQAPDEHAPEPAPAPAGRWVVRGTSAHPRRVFVLDD